MLTTPIERFYRHLLLVERLEQIQSEIAILSESLGGYTEAALVDLIADAAEKVALDRAESFLIQSVKMLREARSAVRQRIQPELLEAELQASIEYVNQSPERMRREQGA